MELVRSSPRVWEKMISNNGSIRRGRSRCNKGVKLCMENRPGGLIEVQCCGGGCIGSDGGEHEESILQR